MPKELCVDDRNVLIIDFNEFLGSWFTDALVGKKAKKILSWESKYTLDNWLKEIIGLDTHFFSIIGNRRVYEKID